MFHSDLGKLRNASCSKRILVISALNVWSMGNKRGAQSLYQTLWGYAKRGWEVHFLTAAPGPAGLLEKNIIVHRFSSPGLTNANSRSLLDKGFSILIGNFLPFILLGVHLGLRLERRFRFDLFYGYTMHGVPVASILGRLLKRPVITRFQGTKTYPHMATVLGRIRVRNHLLAMKMPTDLMIMANDGTRGDEVARMLHIPEEKFRFWINGLSVYEDLEVVYPVHFKAENGIPEHTRIILSVSRLVHWKRVDRLIQAICEVVSQTSDVLFIVLGDGPERPHLEALVDELGVGAFVRFEGAVPHKKVMQFMEVCDVFVSLYDLSNVGNPLLEAMSCGCCVVTLNTGDTGDFVRNGETGMLLEVEDLGRLPNVLNELLSSSELCSRLGQNAASYARQHFWTWDQRMDAEVSLAETLLERYAQEH